MEADTGVMWPQAKDYREPPEAGRDKEQNLLQSLWRGAPRQRFVDVWPPDCGG